MKLLAVTLIFSRALTSGAATPLVLPTRNALLWLVPYSDVVTVDGYVSMWGQLRNSTGGRAGYMAAGSAYALKHNGSFGYADTAAGEGLYGDTMERYGFPALKQLNLSTLAMTYFTHYDGMAIVFNNPAPFIEQLVKKVLQQGLMGVDIDYEPQNAAAAEKKVMSDPGRPSSAVDFHGFIVALAKALSSHGLILTIDVGGSCGGNFGPGCAAFADIPGLVQMNSEDTFGVGSVSDFQTALQNNYAAGLGSLWAPGFEPGNCGPSVFSQVLAYAASSSNVTRLATWAVHEWNVGPQPQWYFDAINAFLDAPAQH